MRLKRFLIFKTSKVHLLKITVQFHFTFKWNFCSQRFIEVMKYLSKLFLENDSKIRVF